MAVRSRTLFTKYAVDGTNNPNANGDYSTTAGEFVIEVPAGETKLNLSRVIVYIEDSGTFKAETYGALAALTNGVSLVIEKNGVETDLTDSTPIKTNAQWGRLCYDVDVKTWGNGNSATVVRWTFSKSGVDLSLQMGDRVIVRLNDNLTGLIDHTFLFQGYSENHGL
jgi:hypothetical protein